MLYILFWLKYYVEKGPIGFTRSLWPQKCFDFGPISFYNVLYHYCFIIKVKLVGKEVK